MDWNVAERPLELTVFAPIAPSLPVREDEPYARDEMLQEIFEQTARRYPSKLALRLLGNDPEYSRRTELTYGQLAERAIRFARTLQTMGVRRGDRVVICLPRGLDQYMAILGTLWAGACYVPVDWTYPQDRIDFIAEDSGATLIVTDAERAGAMRVQTWWSTRLWAILRRRMRCRSRGPKSARLPTISPISSTPPERPVAPRA